MEAGVFEARVFVVNADRQARGRDMDPRVTLTQVGAMTLGGVGARSFVFNKLDSRLTFTIGRGDRQVSITLEPDDTYTVRTTMQANDKEVFWHSDVYFDDLPETVWQAHLDREGDST